MSELPHVKIGETPPATGSYILDHPAYGGIVLGYRCSRCMEVFGPNDYHDSRSCKPVWSIRVVDMTTGETIDPDHYQAYVAKQLAKPYRSSRGGFVDRLLGCFGWVSGR